MYLGVDPAKDFAHWAVLDSEGGLVACGTLPVAEIRDFVPYEVKHAFVELMECYKNVAGSNPKSLLAVQLTAGRMLGHLEAKGIPTSCEVPKVWKGSTNKAAMQSRLAGIYGLEDSEFLSKGAVKKHLNDVKDAALMAVRLRKIHG